MSRLKGLRPAFVLGIAFAALWLAGAGPSSPPSSDAVIDPAQFANSLEPGSCQADEPLFSTVPAPGASFESATPGCKACKNLPQCGCTYQGHPRISCDPCCYQAYPRPICLS